MSRDYWELHLLVEIVDRNLITSRDVISCYLELGKFSILKIMELFVSAGTTKAWFALCTFEVQIDLYKCHQLTAFVLFLHAWRIRWRRVFIISAAESFAGCQCKAYDPVPNAKLLNKKGAASPLHPWIEVPSTSIKWMVHTGSAGALAQVHKRASGTLVPAEFIHDIGTAAAARPQPQSGMHWRPLAVTHWHSACRAAPAACASGPKKPAPASGRAPTAEQLRNHPAAQKDRTFNYEISPGVATYVRAKGHFPVILTVPAGSLSWYSAYVANQNTQNCSYIVMLW